jgi:hypothetical protein
MVFRCEGELGHFVHSIARVRNVRAEVRKGKFKMENGKWGKRLERRFF